MAGGPADRARDSAPIRTFLIADIRGYTSFTQTRGDEAAARLAATFADVAQEVVNAAGGRVQELRGDEAMCVFASPRQAIRAAVELQRRFVALTLDDPGLPFGVGVGIDAGEAVRVKGGYRGGALNLAARLCSIATAGEILASREAVHLARQMEDVDYVDRGHVVLKGIDPPPVVVRVLPRPDPAADPSFRAAVLPQHAQLLVARNRRRRRRRLVAAATAALLLADVGVVIARSDNVRALAAIGTNAVGIVDVGRSVLFDRVPVGAGPGALTADSSAVWVANSIDGTVSSIDLGHHAVANTLPVGKDPAGIAIAAGAVWVTNADDRSVSRIDERSKVVVGHITVGNGPTAVAAGGGAVWVANTLDGTLSVIDPATDRVTATVPVGAAPSAIAVGAAVWVTNSGSASLSRIDPRSRQTVATIPVGNDPSGVALAGGAVWVANTLDGTVSRIDPATNSVTATVDVHGEPSALAADGNTIWVADAVGDRVSRLSTHSNRVAHVVELGNSPQAAVVAGGRLWLSARGSGREHRGGTLRLAAERDASLNSLDPAAGYTQLSWLLDSDVFDGLVAFQRVGGPGGGLVVPDLARALPTVTDAGLTYTFQIRSGITFSDGRPVRPGDVVRSMTRMLQFGNGVFYYEGVVGARECNERHRCAGLAQGLVADDSNGTVRIRLTQPDPELLYKLALPFASVVGPGAPAKDANRIPLIGTGPYVFDGSAPKDHVVLRRNQRFREWSHVARPDGYPDVIDLLLIDGDQAPRYVTATVAGAFDFASGLLTPPQIAMLRTTQPTQLHPFAQPATRYEFLNVRRAPFSDLRVRQALNYAIDRNAAVNSFGGELLATPTCQILPPTLAGYQPYCPFTQHPDAAGSWKAPDLQTARRLVAASGTAGMQVTVMTTPVIHDGESAELVAALKTLGYRVKTDEVHGSNGADDYFRVIGLVRNHPQAGAGGWFADYPAPSNFIQLLLTCASITQEDNQNPGEFCDRTLDDHVRAALTLQASDPAAATRLWADVDKRLTDSAAWIPLVNERGWDLVSARVGNYQHHPEWGALLDQFWVQ